VRASLDGVGCGPVSCKSSLAGGGGGYMRLRLGPRGGRNYVWGGQGVPQERDCHFPGEGGVSASVSVLKQRVVSVRTPGPSCPQLVLVRGHAGPVINKLSQAGDLLGEIIQSNGSRKSTSPQNRQLTVHFYRSKQQVDGFVGELTF
jgi:hypothetical protein